jgi:hypothetical protein
VAEYFFDLSKEDQREALEYGRAETGRPAHLLEKDVWVVWTLRTLFESPLSADLTFKGGTSLSKVYKVIDRFSEDLDLTYDIRKLIPDLIGAGGDLPASRSQASKWAQAVRHRLPDWITQNVQPVLQAALMRERLDARLELGGQQNDKLLLHYPALTQGTGYVAPVVTLEFGARATGEPHQVFQVTCDIAEHLPDVSFPTASPLVMSVARTFWEKATAAHVFCAQGRIRSERYARHWHDLAAIARSPHFTAVMADRPKPALHRRHGRSRGGNRRRPPQVLLLHRKRCRRPSDRLPACNHGASENRPRRRSQDGTCQRLRRHAGGRSDGRQCRILRRAVESMCRP